MEPRHTPSQSSERRRLPPWPATFASVRNGHGLCTTAQAGRHDQKYPYTPVAGAAHNGFGCIAGETMSGGDATPNFDWHRIWSNLHASWIPDIVRSLWYMAIHDILPTNERLHRIALANSAHCTHCGQIDTLSHRLTDCGAEKDMWRWTQGHLATMLRTHPCHIPEDWPLRPRFSLWPPQRHGAVLWVLAHFVFYRVQHPTTPTLEDFADFM
jgi:hypothetical protein